ncbi:MAG: IMP dehydrogenase, partial [Candidatus Jordarchaeales archaeon]
LLVGAAISPFDRKRALALDAAGVDILVVDVAHGLNLNALSSMEKISKEVNAWIIYGNIATKEAAEEVITSDIENLAGLRVGLGGGSICLTTHVTGVGVPTLTATALVADAVHEYNAKLSVIADGGIRNSGDIVKALGAGANAVMCGYLFAGTDEAPSEKVYIRGVPMKRYRGMASPSAIRDRYASDRYARKVKEVPEGIEGVVPYRGSVKTVVKDLVAAIQAGFGYVGARNIEELWKKAAFSKRTLVGLREALPHDVIPETPFPEKYENPWL